MILAYLAHNSVIVEHRKRVYRVAVASKDERMSERLANLDKLFDVLRAYAPEHGALISAEIEQ